MAPWTKDNPPPPSKNWNAEEQEKCTAAANAVLRDGGWEDASDEKKKELEQTAIFACIRAAGKGKKVKEIPAELLLKLAEQNPELSDFQLVEKASEVEVVSEKSGETSVEVDVTKEIEEKIIEEIKFKIIVDGKMVSLVLGEKSWEL